VGKAGQENEMRGTGARIHFQRPISDAGEIKITISILINKSAGDASILKMDARGRI
jgi:hypothetical protein